MTIVLQDWSGNIVAGGDGVLRSALADGAMPHEVGHLRFTTSRFIASTTGNITLTVERYGGSRNALSATITQSASNRAAGKFAATPIAVSFADGEIGVKLFNFNITTAPSDGAYWINLTLQTGPVVARHWWDHNSEIEVTDGVSVPVVDTTNVYEVGPTGDWTNMVDAFRAVVAPALVYVRGGSYNDEDYLGDGQGINPNNSGSRADRIIIAAYPGEVVTVNANTAFTDPLTQTSTKKGINFRTSRTADGASGIEGWTIKGLALLGSGVTYESATDGIKYMIVEDCEISEIGVPEGANVGGVFHHTVYKAVVRNCKIHDIYEDMSLHTTGHDNNACVHGYKQADILLEDNRLYNASTGFYHKNPPKGGAGSSHIVRRNEFGALAVSIGLEEHYVGRADDYHFQNCDIYHNISLSARLFDFNNRGSFYSSVGLSIYNNNCVSGVSNLGGFKELEFYNNISTNSDTRGTVFKRQDPVTSTEDNTYDVADGTSWPTPFDADSTRVFEQGEVRYFDYNSYHPSLSIELSRYHSTDSQLLTDLSSWRLATDHIMPVAIAGQNSVIYDPAFDVNGRAVNPPPAGRFGGTIGVPDSVVVGGNL